MRYGILALDINQVDVIARAGYDCAELSVSAVMQLNDAEFKLAMKKITDSGLCSDVFSEPLPPDIQICTKGFNTFVWREYLKSVCDRVSVLGGQRLVFRNGGSRSVPDEGDLPRAREDVMTFIRTLCVIAGEYGITVMLEPLDESLSNMYNTLDECAETIKILGLPNLTALCSLSYFAYAGLGDIIKHKGIIGYVHIDSPVSPNPQRLCPREDDDYNYNPFFEMLGKINYSGIISINADTYSDFENEIRHALAFLKNHDSCK